MDYLYLKIAEIEKPIEVQLKINMDLGFVVHCMNEKKKMLQEKIDKEQFLYYNEREEIDMQEVEEVEHDTYEEDEDKEEPAP